MRSLWQQSLILTLLLGLSGCSFSTSWFREMLAERAVRHRDFRRAAGIFKSIMADDSEGNSGLKAAQEGAMVAHLELKDYPLAIEFYKHLVLSSPDADARKIAQKSIAMIEFENLQDYSQAVYDFENLLRLDNTAEDAFRFRLNLAKAYLHMNNIDQALSEIDMLVTPKSSPDQVFEGRVLKASTLVQAKRMPEAIGLWESVLKDFPEKSKKENVALNLVVCYEETKEFDRAIEVLERMRGLGYPHPDFLNLRIQRLLERRRNMPLANGRLGRPRE